MRPDDLLAGSPNIDPALFKPLGLDVPEPSSAPHPPRILLLYGSLRERSFSRLASEEAAQILSALGVETKTFNPSGLPLPDDAPETHPKVEELRSLAQWSEGMVWTSPERHGAMTGIMGSPFNLFRLGTVEGLGQKIVEARKGDATAESNVYAPFQLMQYTHNMASGRAKLDAVDNHRYAGLTWTRVKDLIGTRAKEAA